MKKTYFSKRLYKKQLEETVVHEVTHLKETFNRAKRFTFQTFVREKRWGRSLHKESIHQVVKRKFGLNDYVANSVVQEARALFSSQMELNKLYIKQTDEKIKHLKNKLKTERKFFTQLKKIKESLIKGTLLFPKNLPFSLHRSGMVSLERKSETFIWLNLYLFEHQYLDVKLKHLKAKIGRLKHRLDRLEGKKERLKSHIPSVVFGTKKRFKEQFTKEEFIQDHEGWRALFLAARNKEMLVSGRKDAGSGNFVFHYHTATNELHMTTPKGSPITFPAVIFPYGQEKVNGAVTTQLNCKEKKKYGKPISWSIEDHGDYYIIKSIIEVEANEYINFSMSDGVIGVDCNVDHFAWANLTKDGNYLESGTFSFLTKGKSTGQVEKVLEAEAMALVDLAVRKNKPIAMEEMDTTLSKTGDAYGNKKANRLKSIFAYRKMEQAIVGRAHKMGVEVIKVHPAYTSISGKMKYMRKFGISIHQSAAYTIGRRGLGYKEKAPKVLKDYILKDGSHFWKQWSVLHKKMKVNTHALYHLFDVNEPHLGININHSSLREEEQKKLVKSLSE